MRSCAGRPQGCRSREGKQGGARGLGPLDDAGSRSCEAKRRKAVRKAAEQDKAQPLAPALGSRRLVEPRRQPQGAGAYKYNAVTIEPLLLSLKHKHSTMTFKEFVKYVGLIVVSSLLTLAAIFWLSIMSLSFLIQSASKQAGESDKTLIRPHTYIELRLDYPLKEVERDPFARFDPKTFEFRPALTFHQVLKVLEMATTDERIDGIVVHSDGLQAGWAQTEELRQALARFSESGKPVVGYNSILTAKNLYLASGTRKIWAHPMAVADWKGLAAQILFFKDLLRKLHIDVQVIRHGKYKSAVEPFVQKKMSPANRLQTRRMVNGIWNETLRKVAEARRLPVDSLNAWAGNLALRMPQDLVRHGLVDGLLYPDELKKRLAGLSGNEVRAFDIHFVTETDYYYKNKAKEIFKELAPVGSGVIAVLLAEGQIVPGEGNKDEIGADALIGQIRKLRKDDKIDAVVLRINSPGGSAMASEQIWRELKLLAKEKPLVVSMGNVAASGGYYIATAADNIFADRTTITGSIGVFGLIPNLQNAVGALGISVDTVKTHPHADMGLMRPLDTTEKAYFKQMIEFTYHTFLQRVADGRKMNIDRVDSIAQGRVWTGADAVKLGLADKLGGLTDALEYTETLLPSDSKPVRVRYYPQVENPFAALFSLKADEAREQLRRALLPAPLDKAVQWRQKYARMLSRDKIWMLMPYQPDIR